MVDAALAADPATVRWVPKRLMTPAHYAVALRVGVKRPEDIPPAMVMAVDRYPGTARCQRTGHACTTPVASRAPCAAPQRLLAPTSRHPRVATPWPGGCWAPCCAAP